MVQRKPMEFIEKVNPEMPEKPLDDEEYEHFSITGKVKVEGSPEKTIRILRGTGAKQSLILEDVLPWTEKSSVGDVACRGEGGNFNIPLHKVWLDCGYVTGEVTVGVKKTLAIDGVDMLMGNDIAGKRIIPNLQMVEDPLKEMLENTTPTDVTDPIGEEFVPEVFPACAVTRAMARRGITETEEEVQEDQNLGILFVEPCEIENNQSFENVEKVEDQIEPNVEMEIEKSELVKEQENDESLKSLWNEAKRSD